MRTPLNRLLGISALALSLTALGIAQDQGTDNGREFHWTGKLAPDQVVVIKNINGDIDATGSSSADEVEVTAEKSGSGAEDVKIQVVKLNDGIMICANYPGLFNSGHCESDSHFGNSHNNAKVHFTVHMPRNLRFTGKNVNGGVDAESMGRYVEASSVNGSIRIATSSWASANTVNGSIEAKIGRAEWSGDLGFKSVNGSVKVELPANANTEVDFRSVNGHLDSDFPLTVQGSIGRHSVHGTIGSGGRSLEINTVNGSGELRKGMV
ncbi:MAG TPA: DUF4097 family beta strand repeat-containing protein [Terriglobales bacterium]|nr:DUF4097 family beta strand repeat-containing protein [Terriglobales bacterium]